METIINAMLERQSNPFLVEPAPLKQELMTFFSCALRSPDHAGLQPTRFLVLQDKALVELGKAFALSDPTADESKLARLQAMPLRAPMIIVTIARLTFDHSKVPVWEQQVSAGIATQHIQLAAQAMGYGSIWRTGPMAGSDVVREYLGLLESEQVIAFLYIGTPKAEPKRKPNSTPDSVVEFRS